MLKDFLCSAPSFSRLCLTSCVRDGAVFKRGMFAVCFWVSFAEATQLLVLISVRWPSCCLFLNSFVLFVCSCSPSELLSGRVIVRIKSSGPWKKNTEEHGETSGEVCQHWLIKRGDWMWVLVSTVWCVCKSVYVCIHSLFLSTTVNRHPPLFPLLSSWGPLFAGCLQIGQR